MPKDSRTFYTASAMSGHSFLAVNPVKYVRHENQCIDLLTFAAKLQSQA